MEFKEKLTNLAKLELAIALIDSALRKLEEAVTELRDEYRKELENGDTKTWLV